MNHQGHLRDPAQLSDLLGVPFSAEQLEAITAPLTPGVVIAGAGTGKTAVMAARVVWLVGTAQVHPDEVLGLTFTRKAAVELSRRVEASLSQAGLRGSSDGEDIGRPYVNTYDAFAGRLVADHGLLIGVESDQLLISGATRHRLAARAVARWQEPLTALAHLSPATIAERLLKLDAELRAHLVDNCSVHEHDAEFARALDEIKLYRGRPTQLVVEAGATVARRRELLGLVEDYRRLKRSCGLVEFADQMAQAAALVESCSDVAAELRERFTVVLLDEYQDTSAAQARLLRGLFSGPDSDHGRGHPVTAVGDPFQAIYGWRGAAPSNILQFAQDFAQSNGELAPTYRLRVNRRSQPVILDAANRLAEPLRSSRQSPASSDADDDQLLRPAQGAVGGRVAVASFDTAPDEVEWLADHVVAAHDSGLVSAWSQVAVLTRGNQAIGAIYAALAERDVPVEIVGLGGLLQVPEVAEIVATLTLVDDVGANPEVVRLLSGPRWRIGPRDLAVLGDRARELAHQSGPQPNRGSRLSIVTMASGLDATAQLCLMDAVEDPGHAPLSSQARVRLAEFAEELRRLRRHRDEPVLELVHRVMDASGLELELDSDTAWWAAGRSRQLGQFTEAVAGYVDIDGDGELSGLLAWLKAEMDSAEGLDQAVPSPADSVKLLTVHRAKGLEWDVVFLPGVCKDAFPSTRPPDNWVKNPAVLPSQLRGDRDWIPQLEHVTTKHIRDLYPAALAEAQRQGEDRLAYVAITRARRLVVASCHHWSPGRKSPSGPSPYFKVLHSVAELTGDVLQIIEPSPENPLTAEHALVWPLPVDEARLAGLQEAAAMVQEAGRRRSGESPPGLEAHQQAMAWQRAAEALAAEQRARRRRQPEVVLPASVSASSLIVAQHDVGAFVAQLVRPMPRVTGREAGVGTRFHAWLEKKFGVAALLDIDELDPEPPEADLADSELVFRRLTVAFERGRYAERKPACIEEPFILVLDGQQVRGRIDAVFVTPDDPLHDYQVVDWKTSNRPADPLQLALYRLAWARSVGVPVNRVDAVFYHVLSDEVERPPNLLDEPELVALLWSLSRRSDG